MSFRSDTSAINRCSCLSMFDVLEGVQFPQMLMVSLESRDINELCNYEEFDNAPGLFFLHHFSFHTGIMSTPFGSLSKLNGIA